jgi:hypothetical protein
MSEENEDGKDGGKVSIGEALEAIRSGKKLAVPKKAMAAKPSRRMGRATASFWVRNLQESVQRRMDLLYDGIRDDPGAMSQMKRRDFYSSERFTIPLNAVTAVVEMTPGEPPPPMRPISTFGDLDGVDLGQISPEAVPRTGQVNSQALTNGEFAGQTDRLEKLDLSGHLGQQGMQRPEGDPNDPRFSPSSEFDSGKWIIEEIRATPKERGKKLKVNPLIRKMFEKRAESED